MAALDRWDFHQRALLPVLMWVGVTVILTGVHQWVPDAGWLLLHVVTLGVVTTSILVWSQHFAEALLRQRLGTSARRVHVAILATHTVGTGLVLAGVITVEAVFTGAGAGLVALALTAHAVTLVLQGRRALPGRFGWIVRWYAAATALLPFGALSGYLLARDSLTSDWHDRALAAHLSTNVLGMVGITVTATVATFWATVLRTRLVAGQERATRWALPLMLTGVLVAGGGAMVEAVPLHWSSAAGLATYLAGVLAATVPMVRTAVQRSPRDFPSLSIGLAWCWWVTVVLVLCVNVASGVDHAWHGLAVPLAVGFLAQVVAGALSFLVPTVRGGGPAQARRSHEVMGTWAAARVATLNAGLVAWLFVDSSWARVAISVLVLAALLSTPVLILTLVLRRPTPPPTSVPLQIGVPTPAIERPALGRRDLVGAMLGVGAIVGAGALGDWAGRPGSVRRDAVTPTGRTVTVDVSAVGMRFVPDVATVQVGDRLVVNLTNDDPEQVHDLRFDSGASTRRLGPGEKATVDVGVVPASLDGWCTIVGHRAMGMTFRVEAQGGSGPTPTPAPTAAGLAAGRRVDLSQPPARGFVTRDPVLPAIPSARTRALTLTVLESEVEVAPATTMRAMTYDGRVMGPVLVGRVGDQVDVRLVNRGTMGHSIDFHASMNAPDRVMKTIPPGAELSYPVRLDRAGVWLYHCSTMPMTSHIAAGMFGAVIVPPEGLAPVDREYVLVQSEVYLDAEGNVSPERIAAERPDLVVFNGHANQYVHAPLTARVGERVRMWVLAAGPSRGCAFHVVGSQFDTVWKEGAYRLRPGQGSGGAQVLDLAAAQGGFVEMTFAEPGIYPFVNHALVEAERGAKGLITVT